MIFRFGEYEIDSGRYELSCKGERVALEPKSLDVLLHLVRERHRRVSKQELLDTVWAGVHVTESTLTRAVSLVRAAGDQLVVTSQRVDANADVQVWAGRVETRLDDALAVKARLCHLGVSPAPSPGI